jgi:hypothetical protein
MPHFVEPEVTAMTTDAASAEFERNLERIAASLQRPHAARALTLHLGHDDFSAKRLADAAAYLGLTWEHVLLDVEHQQHPRPPFGGQPTPYQPYCRQCAEAAGPRSGS